jgi:hypothetical protein
MKAGSARRTRSLVVGRGAYPAHYPAGQAHRLHLYLRRDLPARRQEVGLILPWCNTAAKNLHLAAISANVVPGRHAVLLLDHAGWHISTEFAIPDDITIVPLPVKSRS